MSSRLLHPLLAIGLIPCVTFAAEPAFPPDGDALLELADATGFAGRSENRKPLTLFARGYGLVPRPQRPAVLWSWNRSEALAAAGRYKDVHAVSDYYDGLALAMRFVTRPDEDAEADPDGILPRVLIDRQKGGYVLRSRWQDGDDCVVQCFANSNPPGGTWSSSEGGIFRIDGLGASWAVRGEGYAQGTARDRLDASMFENLVDVEERYLPDPMQAQGRTMHCSARADGSGVISLDLDAVYRHQPRTAVPDPRARKNRLLDAVLPGAEATPPLIRRRRVTPRFGRLLPPGRTGRTQSP